MVDSETGLTLSNYKLPLRKVEDGFGYYGAILNTLDGELAQCHICGKMFKDIALHASQTHGVYSKEYKEKFGLSRTSSLLSEKERQRRKATFMKWYSSLSPSMKKAIRDKAREGYLKWYKKEGKKMQELRWKQRLEFKNKRGTCPDQLLEKIQEVRTTLGHQPSKREFINETGGQRYYHLIRTTFGSWDNALKMLGLERARNPGNTGKKFKHHSNEELLEYLKISYQETGKPPTISDSRRGLIPGYQVYVNRFGSMPKARLLAGIRETPTRHGVTN